MSKTPSLTKQIADLFKTNQAIGTSRHQAKQAMAAEGLSPRSMGERIHSWGTYKTEMKNAITVFKTIKAEFGPRVKYLRDVTPAMVAWAFGAFEAQHLATNTLVTRLTALTRLEKIARQQKVIGNDQRLVPEGLKYKREFSPRGAYQMREARKIIRAVEAFDPLSALVLELQLSSGARLREAVTVRSDLIRDKRPGQLLEPGSPSELRGIDSGRSVLFLEGKGGRQRVVELLDQRILDKLDLSRQYPLRSDQTQTTQMRAVQRALRRACDELKIKPRGTHGLRATAAQEHFRRQLAAGISEEQAQQATARWLGHGRTQVLKHYLAADQAGQTGKLKRSPKSAGSV
jgi:integrase